MRDSKLQLSLIKYYCNKIDFTPRGINMEHQGLYCGQNSIVIFSTVVKRGVALQALQVYGLTIARFVLGGCGVYNIKNILMVVVVV